MSVLEILMLVCFGASWPFSIMRTWTTKTARGKSMMFLGLLFLGYVFGIANKFINAPGDWVVGLWVLNAAMIAFDLGLCLYYRRTRDRLVVAGT